MLAYIFRGFRNNPSIWQCHVPGRSFNLSLACFPRSNPKEQWGFEFDLPGLVNRSGVSAGRSPDPGKHWQTHDAFEDMGKTYMWWFAWIGLNGPTRTFLLETHARPRREGSEGTLSSSKWQKVRSNVSAVDHIECQEIQRIHRTEKLCKVTHSYSNHSKLQNSLDFGACLLWAGPDNLTPMQTCWKSNPIR